MHDSLSASVVNLKHMTKIHHYQTNIVSDKGFVPSDTKPLAEPISNRNKVGTVFMIYGTYYKLVADVYKATQTHNHLCMKILYNCLYHTL